MSWPSLGLYEPVTCGYVMRDQVTLSWRVES
jgi:hypothetical protein